MRNKKDEPPSFVTYRERYLSPSPDPNLSEFEAIQYGLTIETPGNTTAYNEANVFLRYMLELELSVSDFDSKDVVDVGCGKGFFGNVIKRIGSPKSFINLDCEDNPLPWIEREAHIDVIADANGLPFADESFDIVLAFGSVFGSYWPELPLKTSLQMCSPQPVWEILRTLKKGGVAKIWPISLGRYIWRNMEELRCYLAIRPEFILLLCQIKEKYPEIKIELCRTYNTASFQYFEEGLVFRK